LQGDSSIPKKVWQTIALHQSANWHFRYGRYADDQAYDCDAVMENRPMRTFCSKMQSAAAVDAAMEIASENQSERLP
jgi:hypothetical protein